MGSIPDHCIRDLWRTEWHWGGFYLRFAHVGFPLSWTNVRSCYCELNFRFVNPRSQNRKTGYDISVDKLKALTGWTEASGFDNPTAAQISVFTTACRQVVQPTKCLYSPQLADRLYSQPNVYIHHSLQTGCTAQPNVYIHHSLQTGCTAQPNPVKWVPQACLPESKRPRREPNHWPHNIDCKNTGSYAATDPCIFRAGCIMKHWVSFTAVKIWMKNVDWKVMWK